MLCLDHTNVVPAGGLSLLSGASNLPANFQTSSQGRTHPYNLKAHSTLVEDAEITMQKTSTEKVPQQM